MNSTYCSLEAFRVGQKVHSLLQRRGDKERFRMSLWGFLTSGNLLFACFWSFLQEGGISTDVFALSLQVDLFMAATLYKQVFVFLSTLIDPLSPVLCG
jgi:hypothetical protein